MGIDLNTETPSVFASWLIWYINSRLALSGQARLRWKPRLSCTDMPQLNARRYELALFLFGFSSPPGGHNLGRGNDFSRHCARARHSPSGIWQRCGGAGSPVGKEILLGGMGLLRCSRHYRHRQSAPARLGLARTPKRGILARFVRLHVGDQAFADRYDPGGEHAPGFLCWPARCFAWQTNPAAAETQRLRRLAVHLARLNLLLALAAIGLATMLVRGAP